MSESDDVFPDLWTWLMAILGGERELSEDYIPKHGDKIGIVDRFSIEETALNDNDLVAAMDMVSNAEIEQEFHDAGIDVSVTNRQSKVIRSEHEWTHEVDFEVHSIKSNPLPALIVLAPLILKLATVAIAFIFGYLIVRDLTATTDKIVDKSEAGFGLTMNVVIIGIVILAIIWFFMSVMRR